MAKTKTEVKSLSDHVQSAAKYSGSSLTVSLAVIGILIHFFPNLEPISQELYTILAFVSNLALVVLVKKTEDNTK